MSWIIDAWGRKQYICDQTPESLYEQYKKSYICKKCEYKWETKKSFGIPSICPHCKSKNIDLYTNSEEFETELRKLKEERKVLEKERKEEVKRKIESIKRTGKIGKIMFFIGLFLFFISFVFWTNKTIGLLLHFTSYPFWVIGLTLWLYGKYNSYSSLYNVSAGASAHRVYYNSKKRNATIKFKRRTFL